MPLGTAVTRATDYANTEGNLVWTSSGIKYQVRVGLAFDAAFVGLTSTSNPAAQSPAWQGEALLDDDLELHWPAGDDAAIRAYLAAYVLPELNTWLAANADRFTAGITLGAVSSAAVPASLGVLERIAALLPQMVKIDAASGVPVASLR